MLLTGSRFASRLGPTGQIVAGAFAMCLVRLRPVPRHRLDGELKNAVAWLGYLLRSGWHRPARLTAGAVILTLPVIVLFILPRRCDVNGISLNRGK